ncbi:hypothetical protein [Mycobacterium sp. 1164985.4]|uniref:hypothetical protein n=1 Tax=Mycobacterium sp. 1164985.4 TaxID=1834069 RepID=UPI000802483A|nr:hypothetical protein [Mycobacterium sp. 1164985.4]OBK82510.1 hypothetical protein A5650_23305 [Mycobacterium sp. 1164985.4]
MNVTPNAVAASNDSRPGIENDTEATRSTPRTDDNGTPAGSPNADRFAPVPVWLFGRVPLRSVGVYAGYRAFRYGTAETCSPTETEVAELLGVSVDTVARARRQLVNAKALTVTVGQAHGGRLVYTFRKRPAGTRDGWARVPVALLGRVPLAEVGMYAVLRSFKGADGCRPRVATIAERAGVGTTRTRQMLRVLAAADAIEVVPRTKPDGVRRAPNEYLFHDVADQSQQLDVCAPQRHEAQSLTANPEGPLPADPEGLSPQIPRVFDRKSRCGTRTSNQNQDLDLVGWSTPAARCQPLAQDRGQLAKHLVSPGHDSAGPGPGVAAPGEHRAALGDTGPCHHETAIVLGHSAAESSRTGMTDADRSRGVGWISKPLPDPIVEAQCAALVELLADGQVASGRNAPPPATLGAWTASSRRMLAHDERDYEKAHRLIQDVCADRYWSGRVRNMFDVAERFDEIAAEFARRKPMNAGAESAKRRRDRQVDKRVTDAVTRDTDRAGLGTSRLSGLLSVTPASTESAE